MVVEHTFNDVELEEPAEDDLDIQLQVTLGRMGDEGWSLVAVLPTEHVLTANREYVVRSVRLFFARDRDRELEYDPGIYERCGVKIHVGKFHAALVIYCPSEWQGRQMTVEHLLASSGDRSPIQTRLTGHGPVTCAIWTSLYLTSGSDLHYADYSIKMHLPGQDEFLLATDTTERTVLPGKHSIRLFEQTVTELDWRDMELVDEHHDVEEYLARLREQELGE